MGNNKIWSIKGQLRLGNSKIWSNHWKNPNMAESGNSSLGRWGESLGWSRTDTYAHSSEDIVSDTLNNKFAPLADNNMLSLLYFLIYSLFCSMNKRNFNPDDEKSDE